MTISLINSGVQTVSKRQSKSTNSIDLNVDPIMKLMYNEMPAHDS
jgi:hypothetical protein